jgi:hypothetical protein
MEGDPAGRSRSKSAPMPMRRRLLLSLIWVNYNETLDDVSRINNVARRQYDRSGKPDDYPTRCDGEMYIDVEEDCVHECRSGV